MGCVCGKETVSVDNHKYSVRSRLGEGYFFNCIILVGKLLVFELQQLFKMCLKLTNTIVTY